MGDIDRALVVLTAIGTVAAVVAVVATVHYRHQSGRDQVADAVRSFVADLDMREVLYVDVAVEVEGPAIESLEAIRRNAANLLGVLTSDEDKKLVTRMRDASHEAARAIRRRQPQPGAETHGNWFEDALNHFRKTVRPLVRELCDNYNIPEADRPRIPNYRGGFPGPTVELYYPGPDSEAVAPPDDSAE